MKHNWEYKRLGEICDFLGGGTPSKSNSSFYGGNIPWATVRDMTSFELNTTEFNITEEGVKNSSTQVLPEGMIIICTHVGLGKICILRQDTAINQDLKGVKFKSVNVNKLYFVHWYRSVADFIIDNGKGATVKGVTLDFMRNLKIPVPPVEVQEQIVAELDKLNEMIATRKEQLKELDNLAQSLFYDTFGDPNHSFRYPTKRFEEVTKNLDSRRKPVTKEDRVKGLYPYYGASGIVDYVSDYIFDGMYLLISEDGANLITRTQPIAFIANGKAWVNNHAHIVDTPNKYSLIYLQYFFNLLDFREKITGMAQPKFTQKALNATLVSWPPLKLQQLFASQVEAIERQTELVEASISELQTLLDSRMDYWFN